MDIRICIDVGDIDAAIDFYTKGLGLRLGRRLLRDWAELLGGSSPIDLLGNAAGTAPLGPQHPQRRDYSRHWTPVHLDFVVTDLDASVRRLQSLGAALERPVEVRVWDRMANLADPFGHGIDLLEFNAGGYDALLQQRSERP